MTTQPPDPNPDVTPESLNPHQSPPPPAYQDGCQQRHAERMARLDARQQILTGHMSLLGISSRPKNNSH